MQDLLPRDPGTVQQVRVQGGGVEPVFTTLTIKPFTDMDTTALQQQIDTLEAQLASAQAQLKHADLITELEGLGPADIEAINAGLQADNSTLKLSL